MKTGKIHVELSDWSPYGDRVDKPEWVATPSDLEDDEVNRLRAHRPGCALGLVWTKEQCEEALLSDVHWACNVVNRLVTYEHIDQDIFDSLVDFVFNVGAGELLQLDVTQGLECGEPRSRHEAVRMLGPRGGTPWSRGCCGGGWRGNNCSGARRRTDG